MFEPMKPPPPVTSVTRLIVVILADNWRLWKRAPPAPAAYELATTRRGVSLASTSITSNAPAWRGKRDAKVALSIERGRRTNTGVLDVWHLRHSASCSNAADRCRDASTDGRCHRVSRAR